MASENIPITRNVKLIVNLEERKRLEIGARS